MFQEKKMEKLNVLSWKIFFYDFTFIDIDIYVDYKESRIKKSKILNLKRFPRKV
jgi:hypothetical protein